jgi:regulator of replication initiation timing
MENQDLLSVVDTTAENLKNLLTFLITEIKRLEQENAELRQRLGQ